MNNSLQVNKTSKPKFSVALQSEGYKNLINNTLQDPKRATNFIANISTAVANNPALQECDSATILTAGLVAESLQLSMNAALGQFHLVPFNDTKNNRKVATPVIGYKGYLQLAMRSGNYKKINVVAIKEGELIKYDPLDEEIEVNIVDNGEREHKKTIGYYAMFEYLNGFKKTMYWSKEKMVEHAKKYSQGYKKDLEKGWSYTFWTKDFDSMAKKTMIRQLISQWGIMSVDMQKAYFNDMGVIDTKGNVEYVDNVDFEQVNVAEAPQEVEETNNEDIKVDKNTGEVVGEPKVEDTPKPAPKNIFA